MILSVEVTSEMDSVEEDSFTRHHLTSDLTELGGGSIQLTECKADRKFEGPFTLPSRGTKERFALRGGLFRTPIGGPSQRHQHNQPTGQNSTTAFNDQEHFGALVLKSISGLLE